MTGIKGFILDVEHEEGNKLGLWIKTGNKTEKVTAEYDPYFYVEKEKVSKKELESIPGVTRVEPAEKNNRGKQTKLWKVYTKDPGEVIHAREKIKDIAETFEARIRFINRFLVDNDLYASNYYNFSIQNGMLKKAKKIEQEPLKLKQLAFDIETYNPEGISDPLKDPVLMIGIADKDGSKVLTWKDSKETEMFEEFVKLVQEKDYDVLTGYNSNDFDIPYMKKRARKLKVKLLLGRDGTEPGVSKSGLGKRSRINGRIHLDTYRGVSFLTGIGALRLPKNDLESIYKEFFGKEKLDIDCARIHEYWDKGGKELELLKEYNRQDAEAAYRLGEEILPLYIELSRILGLPLYDVTWMTSSQMVEWLIIREAVKRNEIIPRIPKEKEVIKRMRNPIKGAFVKLPEKGLHEKIVVCDFRSLYPSIIMSFNIDSHSLVPEGEECEDCYKTPLGHRFRKKPAGLIPTVLRDLVYTRKKVKKEMEKTDKRSDKYKMLHFKQWGLKIIANACYGYMGYPRARFYSRECAESVTALGRKYIQETMKKAEEEGFNVLYVDTDSLFLKLGDKSPEDAKRFIQKVNKNLPADMELEYQGYYPRGLFVTKRGEKEAAKKKYALIREDSTVEIKGFELVRRDWAKIARETQEKVIAEVLEHGDPEKAVEHVKNIITELKRGNVPLEDLVIYTQLTRRIQDYEQIGPHVKAAEKLKKAGYRIRPGMVLEYIIVKGGGSISNRAWPLQLIGNRKPDTEYYIHHQILPASMKILSELGIEEDEVLKKGKQTGLGKWMK